MGLVVAAAIVLLSVGCDSGGEQNPRLLRTPLGRPTDTENLVIGLVGTMTGPDAWRGEDAYEGADLAVHELNAAIAPGTPVFRLVTLDDEGDPEEALSSVQRLTELETLVGVVYAGPPEVLPDAEDALAGRGVPALVLYGDPYSARRLTAHVFQMAPPVLWQSRRIVGYLSDDRRYERFGVLVRRSPEGTTAANSFRAAASFQPIDHPRVQRYDPGRPERALEALKRRRTEAVVVQGSPADFETVLAALGDMGAGYASTDGARIGSARSAIARTRRRFDWWAPQVLLLDLGFSARSTTSPPPGTVVAESYARGAYYLPVPSFERFRVAFREWWAGKHPLGWQYRAYDATKAIGWAVERSDAGADIADTLERLHSKRFGSLDMTFGPDDHTAVDAGTIGLWVVPREGAEVRELDRRPDGLPWVPLARGFSIDGETLDIPSEDWAHLVRNAPPPAGPAPRFSRLRFGVRSGRSDPVH
jgi:ABC-type branched-subunit amino acid transport system substrate-binding protein